jgi:hypothetical protein
MVRYKDSANICLIDEMSVGFSLRHKDIPTKQMEIGYWSPYVIVCYSNIFRTVALIRYIAQYIPVEVFDIPARIRVVFL